MLNQISTLRTAFNSTRRLLTKPHTQAILAATAGLGGVALAWRWVSHRHLKIATRSKQIETQAPWNELPLPIINKILIESTTSNSNTFDVQKYVSYRLVCKNWNKSTLNIKQKFDFDSIIKKLPHEKPYFDFCFINCENINTINKLLATRNLYNREFFFRFHNSIKNSPLVPAAMCALITGNKKPIVSDDIWESYFLSTLKEGNISKVLPFIQNSEAFDSNPQKMWERAFHKACEKKLPAFQKELLQNVYKYGAESKEMLQNALAEAALSNAHESVKYLLNIPGIDPNSKDDYGNTPLHHAAIINDYEFVEYLLSVPGIDPNSKDCYGDTPLHQAACNGHETVKVLLADQRVESDLKNDECYMPVHKALENGTTEAFNTLANDALVQFHLKYEQVSRELLLILAVKRNAFDLVEHLLKFEQIDPNAHIKWHYPPLFQAILNGNVEMVTLLLQNDADPILKDSWGYMAIHYALEKKEIPIFNTLFDNQKVQEHLKNDVKAYELLLMIAAERNDLLLVTQLLKDKKINPNACVKSYRPDCTFFRGHVKREWIDERDRWSPLHISVANNNLDLVKILLKDNRIDINAKTSVGNFSVLHLAAIIGTEEMIQFLLTIPGIDFYAKDAEGKTAIKKAEEGRRSKSIKKLLEPTLQLE